MSRRASLVGAAIGALVGVGLLTPGASLGTPLAARDGVPGGGFQQTRTLQRTFVDAQGAVETVGSYDVTVRADQTTDLRGRERVRVSWSGAAPSGGRASNPYGEKGLNQEYPVVVLQCRGRDDASLPLDRRLRPETCWTSSYFQRSQVLSTPNQALWTADRHAPADAAGRLTGIDALPDGACKDAVADGFLTHLTPFVAVSGKVYPSCDATTMPPEAAVDAAFPPAEIAAFSDGEGRGSVDFEVRSSAENESLGCRREVACSIVVVPIIGLSCAAPTPETAARDRDCRETGEFASGSSNFANQGIDRTLGPALWWSPSNWDNRFSIPIDFGLPPDACDVLDPRAPVGFSGSELMAQAALQWAPAYCLNKRRFKFQLNQMPDQTAWNLMQTGGSPAAFVSLPHEQSGPDPVAYAPTAVSGFGIGYQIDLPDNGGAYTGLRLNARLVAKLLTQSYPASSLGRDRPGLQRNPLSIQVDPEFQRLNPGLSDRVSEAGATLLSLSNSSDLVKQLSAYLAADKDAAAFVAGRPDPWGMVVNPAYKGLELPRGEWPLLDTFEPKTNDPCRNANPAVYLSQVAAPVTTLRKIADALIDAWPNVQTRCDGDPTSPTGFKLGRIDRQSYGARFMLGLVTLGDAARYGLSTAALHTTGDTYVAPNAASMAKAVGVAKQKKARGPFALDQTAIAKARTAYPGTQIVYTAARTSGLAKKDAATVASFITIATSEGQRQGRGNGQLPAGYLPVRKSGATAALWKAAQDSARAIAAQKAPAAVGDSAGVPAPAAGAPAAAPAPADAVPAPAALAPAASGEVVTARTRAASSTTALSLIPSLLVIGALAAVGSVVTRLGALRRRRTW